MYEEVIAEQKIMDDELYICPHPRPNTIEIGIGMSETKSHIKIGNLIIHNTHRFNWFNRKMWKLFFGFEIENIKERELCKE